MKYTKLTERMDFYINEKEKSIIIKLKWRYNWLTAINVTPWGFREKKAFEKNIENAIKKSWSNHFIIGTYGTSDFAKKHYHTRWKLLFEIESVSNNQHWSVYVTKIQPLTRKTSAVNWNERKIKLDSEDLKYRLREYNNEYYSQKAINHEFGHIIGNTNKVSSVGHGDEYKYKSSYYNDKNSIMNIGNKLRIRHKEYILQQLNTIIPNTTFI